jgi:hypothetical protein
MRSRTGGRCSQRAWTARERVSRRGHLHPSQDAGTRAASAPRT